jgi:hypothetical protein
MGCMFGVLSDPVYGEQGFAAELAALDAAGLLVAPADPQAPDGPVEILAVDWFDDAPQRMSRVDALEWQLWAGVEQDDAERAMLADRAPKWVFLPPGGELATALEGVRPQAESPIALIEVMKAAARLVAWAESVKMSAMASFERQRQAQAADIPRPSELDARGRPTDPERSRAAEVACALRLAPDTVRRHIDTALRLTGVLSATHTALRCGAVTLSKAIAICNATRDLDPVQARAVEAHVLKRAAGQTHANLLRSLARQVAKYNTNDKAERHRDAVTKRECRIIPLADGMAGLWVTHTADKIQQMWIVIQAIADLAKRGTPATSQATAPQTDLPPAAAREPTRPALPRRPPVLLPPTQTTDQHRTTTPRQPRRPPATPAAIRTPPPPAPPRRTAPPPRRAPARALPPRRAPTQRRAAAPRRVREPAPRRAAAPGRVARVPTGVRTPGPRTSGGQTSRPTCSNSSCTTGWTGSDDDYPTNTNDARTSRY